MENPDAHSLKCYMLCPDFPLQDSSDLQLNPLLFRFPKQFTNFYIDLRSALEPCTDAIQWGLGFQTPRLEKTSGDHHIHWIVNHTGLCPCFSSSSTTGHSTASLGNLSQCFTTIPRKGLFKQNFLHINCLLPLVLLLYTTKKNLCPAALPGLHLQFNLSPW